AILMKEQFISSKKINTSEFRSGVYFISFEAPGVKSFTRKIIVRH
ncbi:MAG: T9SS C-terminal target domain-containing protein, partial [Flavobacteriia bacterium]|nr:T9SS C-terminal target domain-containing protein [Flavobacteriia bacterium]